jgi:glycosyltransferase involved in cell wall biosynthesis
VEETGLNIRNEHIDVSIIIPCKNEAENLKATLDSLLESKNSLNFEVIIVDDGSIDSGIEFLTHNSTEKKYKKVTLIKTNNIGAARARNAGAETSKGNYLFFCDAHITVSHGWLDALVNTLLISNSEIVAPAISDMKNPSSIGYGQTWDNELQVKWLTNKPEYITEIPIACGCAFGIKKEAFNKIHGFDTLFQVWGKEDEELCFKAWLYGLKAVVNPEVEVKHLFRKKHPYTVTTANVIHNLLCLSFSHFKEVRLLRTIELVNNLDFFETAAGDIQAKADLILAQRELYLKERKNDDDFFFKRFNIDF